MKNFLLFIALLALVVAPFLFAPEAEFLGADEEAKALSESFAPGYTPWLSAFWEPPSTEIQSLLFALQAALGAGGLGYCIGYIRGRRVNAPD